MRVWYKTAKLGGGVEVCSAQAQPFPSQTLLSAFTRNITFPRSSTYTLLVAACSPGKEEKASSTSAPLPPAPSPPHCPYVVPREPRKQPPLEAGKVDRPLLSLLLCKLPNRSSCLSHLHVGGSAIDTFVVELEPPRHFISGNSWNRGAIESSDIPGRRRYRKGHTETTSEYPLGSFKRTYRDIVSTYP